MQLLESITNSMDTNLSKLWEIMKDSGAWHAVVYGAAKSRTWLSNWTTTFSHLAEILPLAEVSSLLPILSKSLTPSRHFPTSLLTLQDTAWTVEGTRWCWLPPSLGLAQTVSWAPVLGGVGEDTQKDDSGRAPGWGRRLLFWQGQAGGGGDCWSKEEQQWKKRLRNMEKDNSLRK